MSARIMRRETPGGHIDTDSYQVANRADALSDDFQVKDWIPAFAGMTRKMSVMPGLIGHPSSLVGFLLGF